MRWVLEGEWSGYVPSQRKVVHRTVTSEANRYRHLHWIEFTDDTILKIRLRQCAKHERVQKLDSYTKLIDQAAALGKAGVTVRELS